jgi:penicillin amidase
MQTDNYNVFGEMALPVLVSHMEVDKLTPQEKNYFEIMKKWNCRNDPDSKGATLFTVVWDSLETTVWRDEFIKAGLGFSPDMRPDESTLLDDIHTYPSFRYFDDINTLQIETLSDDVTAAFKKAAAVLRKADEEGKMAWSQYKDTRVEHLLRKDELSRLHLPIGGGTNTINAAKAQHGPSWRMIVSLTPQTEAWGIYPGGESGNPGSRFYDNFIDDWAAGRYYPLWVMTKSEAGDSRVKWTMTFDQQIPSM